jgi:hypothetical protein
MIGVLLTNVVMIALAVTFAALLILDFVRPRPLPPAPAPRQTKAASARQTDQGAGASDEKLGSYNVIAAKSLFNPSRSEDTSTGATPAAPLPPKPVLHGLVVDGQRSVAYLEDPVSKRVLAYRVGDAVAGGTLEKIGDDRIEIRRADGQMDVLLRDPGKPKPTSPPSGAPATAEPQSPPGPSAPPEQQPPTRRAPRRLE